MTLPLFTLGPISILERARTVLTDDARWTALLAAYATQRPNGPTLAQPKDHAVEFAPIDEDDQRPPQSFPAVRLDVVGSEHVYGVNMGVAKVAHTLEVRTMVKVTSMPASGLAAASGTKWSTSNATLQNESLALAARYLLEQGLSNTAIGTYNVLYQGTTSKGMVVAGDATFYRVVMSFTVHQRVRSGRYEYPLTD